MYLCGCTTAGMCNCCVTRGVRVSHVLSCTGQRSQGPCLYSLLGRCGRSRSEAGTGDRQVGQRQRQLQNSAEAGLTILEQEQVSDACLATEAAKSSVSNVDIRTFVGGVRIDPSEAANSAISSIPHGVHMSRFDLAFQQSVSAVMTELRLRSQRWDVNVSACM